MKPYTEIYKLEKSTWTQDDFENMGWHDASIYGFTFENRNENKRESWETDFVIDLDYIFEWVHPVPPASLFSFWVAPCTLAFINAFDLQLDIGTDGAPVDLLEISDLSLKSKKVAENGNIIYDWTIELQQGEISLKSTGFVQTVRKHPIHIRGQVLNFEERGGINFERSKS